MVAAFEPPVPGQSLSETIIPDVKTTLNLFGMHLRKVSGEWDYPQHAHPQYEFNYVLEGSSSSRSTTTATSSAPGIWSS